MRDPSDRSEHAARAPEGRSAGFTLLELLVVLAILVLLASIATPQVLKYLGRAKTDTAKIQIENLSAALDYYRLDLGSYPSNEQGLEALVKDVSQAPGWNGPYVKKKEMLIDPWGNPYRYRFPGEHGSFDVYSLGADNAQGGEGEDRDVVNW